MIYRLIDLPPNMIGFKVLWQVTEKDFEEVMIPIVQEHVEKTGQLNCLLIVNNSIRFFKVSALSGLKRLIQWKTHWRRVAIVAESKIARFFINFLSLLAPGEFKGFSHSEINEAIDWASENKQAIPLHK